MGERSEPWWFSSPLCLSPSASRPLFWILAFVFLFSPHGYAGAGAELSLPLHFSTERTLAHIEALAAMGTRKTGSSGGRAAADYVARQFIDYGLEVEFQPVKRWWESRRGEWVIGSANVLARNKGVDSGPYLVISAHYDTVAATSGANDNGSGVAVMLEAARLLRSASIPLLFVAFGAEEEGMLGSYFFADRFDLGKIRAVINLDSVGQGKISPFPSPRLGQFWAYRDSYQVARQLGLGRFSVEPFFIIFRHFNALWDSDHTAFLERGIPAFTLTGMLHFWTYHNGNDLPENIEPESLETAGRLLLGLVEKYSRGELGAENDSYFIILPLGEHRFFITSPLLVAFIIVTFALLGIILWRRRGEIARVRRREVATVMLRAGLFAASGLGFLALALLIDAAWHRRLIPWFDEFEKHWPFLAAMAVLGGAVARRFSGAKGSGPAPSVYYFAAIALLSFYSLTLLAVGMLDFAAYTGFPLFFLLLASLFRSEFVKIALGAVALYPLLLFSSPYYRNILSPLLLYLAASAVLIFLLSIPFILYFAGIGREGSLTGRAARLAGGKGIVVLIIFGFALAAAAPPDRPQIVYVFQDLDADTARAELFLGSRDRLQGIEVNWPERLRLDLLRRRISYERRLDQPPVELAVSKRGEQTGGEQLVEVDIVARLPVEAGRAVFSYSSNRDFQLLDVEFQDDRRDKSQFVRFYCGLAREWRDKIRLKLPEEASLRLDFSAIGEEDPLGAGCRGPNHVFLYNSTIKASREILP